MQTVKNEVVDLLKRLPDNCTLEDIQYYLYAIQKIERGLKDEEEGRIYEEKEMKNFLNSLEFD